MTPASSYRKQRRPDEQATPYRDPRAGPGVLRFWPALPGSGAVGRILLAAALVWLGLVLDAGTTQAQAAGCEASQIAVVVSFNSLGGGTQIACTGDSGSGIGALQQAGFGVTLVTGQAFVCRINGVPTSDPCARTPPATAYWSYWTASMGGSWSFSSIGAGSRDPAPGSVEGWSFGAGSPPAIAPPDATEPPPPPPPAPPPPAPDPGPGGGSGGGGTGGGGSGGADAPGTPGGGAGDSEGAGGGPAGQSPPDGAESGGATTGASDPTDRGDEAEETTDEADQDPTVAPLAGADHRPPGSNSTSGPLAAVLATLAGLGLLGGGAYWQHRRRSAGHRGASS